MISKGSKAFPFREEYVDPDRLTLCQAQLEYDFLMKRRVKFIRAITKEYSANKHLDEFGNLQTAIIECREVLRGIDNRILFLIEEFPECER